MQKEQPWLTESAEDILDTKIINLSFKGLAYNMSEHIAHC